MGHLFLLKNSCPHSSQVSFADTHLPEHSPDSEAPPPTNTATLTPHHYHTSNSQNFSSSLDFIFILRDAESTEAHITVSPNCIQDYECLQHAGPMTVTIYCFTFLLI